MIRIGRDNLLNWLTLCFIISLPLSWASFVFGSFYRMLTIILLVIYLLTTAGKLSVPLENKSLFWAWTVYTAYSVIVTFWAKKFSNALTESLGMLLVCAIAVIFACRAPNEDTESRFDRAWMASGVACLVLFFLGERAVIGSRETLIILGTPTDHNEFAGIFIVPISLGIYSFLKTTNIRLKLLHMLVILLEVYVVLLTGSRGALISIVIAVSITIFLYKKVSLKYMVTVLLLFLGASILITMLILPLIPEEVLGRFTLESVSESGGTGRVEIWSKGWKKIWEGSLIRFIFGYGSGAELVMSRTGAYSAMHNQLLQILANYGVMGIVLYLNLILKSFTSILRRNKRYVGGFCGMMVLSMTLSMSPSYKPLWILLLMGFCNCGNSGEYAK